MILICPAFKLLVGLKEWWLEKSFGFQRNPLPVYTYRSWSSCCGFSRSWQMHNNAQAVASQSKQCMETMITAIYRYPVFQRGLYVLHELCKKVLQTLRLCPATVYVQLQMALVYGKKKFQFTVKNCAVLRFGLRLDKDNFRKYWAFSSVCIGSSRSAGTREAGSALLPQLLRRGKSTLTKSLSMWQTEGDHYLHSGSHQHSFISALYQISKTCRLSRHDWCCASFIIT